MRSTAVQGLHDLRQSEAGVDRVLDEHGDLPLGRSTNLELVNWCGDAQEFVPLPQEDGDVPARGDHRGGV